MNTQQTQDYHELTNREKRVEIAKRVGGLETNPRTDLTKSTVNSLAAYFTGELPVQPAYLHAEWAPNKPGIKETISVEVVRVLSDGEHDLERGEYGDIGGDSPIEMMGWFTRLDHGDSPDPSWSSDELDEILMAMDRIKDQREWLQDG